MITTYETTMVLFENILYHIKDVFLGIGNTWYLIFALYVGYIIILLWRLKYANTTFQKINTLFKVSIDTLYYNTSILLYNNKSNIHNFHDNIPLLLQYKTDFIYKKDKAIYYNDCALLMKEIEYIYKLIDPNKEIENRETIQNNHTLLLKLSNTIETIHSILSVSTLGIYKIFQ